MAKAKRDAMQEEEVEEETLPDEIRYRDQLTGAFRRAVPLPPHLAQSTSHPHSCCAGAAVLGRVDLLASINGLFSLWDERLQSYEAHVMQQQQLDACSAVIAHEQVHWLLLIGGHLMADEAEGEDAQIPEEVQSFAAKVRLCSAKPPCGALTPYLLSLTCTFVCRAHSGRKRLCAGLANHRTCLES